MRRSVVALCLRQANRECPFLEMNSSTLGRDASCMRNSIISKACLYISHDQALFGVTLAKPHFLVCVSYFSYRLPHFMTKTEISFTHHYLIDRDPIWP